MYESTPTLDPLHSQLMPLNELKQRTLEQHLRLERELNIESWLIDRETYRRLLCVFYGYWRPWESRVAASNSPEILSFFAPRRKRELLEADLRFLGMSQQSIEELATADVPAFVDRDELLGSMYVTEGSTLGGQVISRMIEERLKLKDGNGYSFYRSYGPRVGIMWREFGRFFNESVSPTNLKRAVIGAQQTFEGIRQWLGATR